MQNQICPECGKKFHACRSCGLQYEHQLYYCSSECFRKTFKYEDEIKKVKVILDNIFKKIWELGYFDDWAEDIEDLQFYLYETDIEDYWKGLRENKDNEKI